MTKITLIGAGSITFAKDLLGDIFSYSDLSESTISLMDINEERLSETRNLTEAMIEDNNLNANIQSTTDRREALKDADYVLNMINIGGSEPFRNEVEIPQQYGVKQAVGDTLGPGGVFRGLRTIPTMLDIARDMEELCPDALLLNYTNPMAILCWAVDEATDINIIGLCHSVQHTADALATYADVPREDLKYWVAGINHMAWFLELQVDGKTLYPRLHERMQDEEIYQADNVRFELMKHFGYFVTESSHHLSEYVPYFRTNDETIDDLTVEASFENPTGGHTTEWMPTGGYLNDWLNRQEKSIDEDIDRGVEIKRSNEYAARIIHSLETDTARRMNINVRNDAGAISNLPENACVEVPCLVDGTGIHPCLVGDLPPQLAALIQTNINVQELAVKAGLDRDLNALRQAIKLDPLTGAALSLDEIDEMVDELLKSNAEYLPEMS